MPNLTKSVPKYCRHKASGQAVVTLSGKDFYLGPWKSKASRIEYDRLIGEWAANGRRLNEPSHDPNGKTIVELCAAYWRFAKGHYRKLGDHTSELDNIWQAVAPLKTLYGHTLVAEFGPLAIKALQARMIEDGLSRNVINQRIGIIKRLFRWAVSEELAPPSLHHSLATVMGLQRGRTKARETLPVRPVEDAKIEATLPFLSPVVADMVRFQRLTGARPNEVCIVRPCDVDRNDNVWRYRPASHKTEHHGRERVILIGPRAQDVLRPYLVRESTVYCFSPAEAECHRKATLRSTRKTKVQPSQLDRSKRNAKRKPGDRYKRTSYLCAIRRACGRAFPEPEGLEARELSAWRKATWWTPNQLRHSAATEIRKQFGLEAAQVTLGHASAEVTQVYAERDLALATRVMQQIG